MAKSLDVGHGISIPEFNLNLSIPAGTDSVGEFTAAKKKESLPLTAVSTAEAATARCRGS